MESLTLESIQDIISETIEQSKNIDKRNEHKLSYSNSADRKLPYLQLAKELLEEGYKVCKHEQGIIVNDKFIVGARLRSWRCEGRYKWYTFSKKSFSKILKEESQKCNKK